MTTKEVKILLSQDHWKQAEFIVHCATKDNEGYDEKTIASWNPELAKCLLDIKSIITSDITFHEAH